MIKSLAIGLLTLTATCSTAAFAGNAGSPPPSQGGGILCYFLPWLPICQVSQPQPGSGPAAAPEIDPASAVAALTLLAGGLAALRARRSGKKDV